MYMTNLLLDEVVAGPTPHLWVVDGMRQAVVSELHVHYLQMKVSVTHRTGN